MVLSPPSRHALRALIYMSRRRADAGPVLARQIAAAEDIPGPFLSKILLRLREAGILRSTMGPGGGYALARRPEDIRIGEIIDVFDDLSEQSAQCILLPGPCSEQDSCPLHERWKQFVQDFAGGIAALTLEEVASTSKSAAKESGLSGARGEKPRQVRRRAPRRPRRGHGA
jgi:Rrf2 family transcriptional regulator, iron-sulfur cluster assembly transcription factor